MKTFLVSASASFGAVMLVFTAFTVFASTGKVYVVQPEQNVICIAGIVAGKTGPIECFNTSDKPIEFKQDIKLSGKYAALKLK